jgi:hypothetical protein
MFRSFLTPISERFGLFSSQKYFQRSDFTYSVRKDQNLKNQKEQLPMCTKACGGLG